MRLSDIMSHAGLAIYAEVALVIFLAVFVAIVIRLFRSKRSEMERRARMPLEDNEPTTKEPPHGE
jgi:cbb3-type cytochrome oxidase subunit 3